MAATNFQELKGKRWPDSALIYINGLNTIASDALKTAQSIQERIGCTVFSYHNSTTSEGRVLELKTILLELPKGLEKEFQSFKKVDGRELAEKIKELLPRYGVILLLAHSQGALFIEPALELLSFDQRSRVRAIALGGMVDIEGGANFLFDRDAVALTARAFYEKEDGITHPLQGGSHAIARYLKEREVQAVIEEQLI